MDTPFVFDRYVTGKNFIGRKTVLSNLLEAGEQVVIYEPPKSGKMSVVQQTLYNMRSAGKQFAVAWVNLFNVRTLEDFLVKYGTAVIKPIFSTPAEYADVVEKYLEGTHFVFDQERFASADEVVSLNWGADANDVAAMLRLPARIAADRNIPCIVIIEEFQNLMRSDDYEKTFALMEAYFKEKSQTADRSVSFIMCGSLVNAMKYIFAERKFFYRLVEHLPLQKVDDAEITEYMPIAA